MPRVVEQQMRAYYDRRAPEYDDWWLGTGRFADRNRPGWDEEVAQLVALLRGLEPARTLTSRAGPASSPATCRATSPGSTGARR